MLYATSLREEGIEVIEWEVTQVKIFGIVEFCRDPNWDQSQYHRWVEIGMVVRTFLTEIS